MPPLVSVILPTYRRAAMLEGCLDALDRQTYRRFEVIVVDQSPEDATRVMVRARAGRSAARLELLHSAVAGVSLARNLGLRAASGALVAFTDDDAVPEPGWLAALVDAFARTPAHLVGGRILPRWAGERPRWFPDTRTYLVGAFDPGGPLAPFPEGSLPMTGNLAIRRAVLERLGGFDEAAGPRPGRPISGEDSLLAWRARGAGCLAYYQPAAVVHHHVPPERMRRRFYLRRCYLEGLSLVDVEHRRGALDADVLERMRRWHRRARRKGLLAAMGRLSLAPWDDPRVLAQLGEAALSAGIVAGCARAERERVQVALPTQGAGA